MGDFQGKYNFSADNYFGVLYSGRHFAGNKNNVVGADFRYRFLKNARLSLSYLNTSTTTPDAGVNGNDLKQNGNGVIGMFQYFVPKFTLWSTYEHYDENFIMESAFLNRTNMNRFQLLAGPNFEMKITDKTIVQRIQAFVYYSRLHDYSTSMTDEGRGVGAFVYFPQFGLLRVTYRDDF